MSAVVDFMLSRYFIVSAGYDKTQQLGGQILDVDMFQGVREISSQLLRSHTQSQEENRTEQKGPAWRKKIRARAGHLCSVL